MLSFIPPPKRLLRKGDWLLAAVFSLFAVAVCILVGLAFVLCSGINMAKLRGSHGAQTVQPETVAKALGGHAQCIVGVQQVPHELGGWVKGDPGMFPHCGRTSTSWEGTKTLLEPEHLPSWAGA